jgi:hypothetical protein
MAVAPREGFEDVVAGFVLIDQRADGAGNLQRYIGTNWMVRTSFAPFMLNVLDYLGGDRQMQEGAVVRPGSSVTLDPPDPTSAIEVRPPTGKAVALGRGAAGKCSFTETNDLGIYEVQANGKTFQRFAVNLFDPLESDIRPDPKPAIKIGHVTVAGQTGWQAGHREIWKELLFLGLAISLLEWYMYNRRIYG